MHDMVTKLHKCVAEIKIRARLEMGVVRPMTNSRVLM